MKRSLVLIITLFMVNCLMAQAPIVNVQGEITSNTTWTNDNIYLLIDKVYVKNGATLTIEPGTIIKGDNASKGTLIITRNGKIMADGKANQPIVFTSNQPAGDRDYGDWGGVIILGNAPTNAKVILNGVETPGQGEIEGGVNNTSGDGIYGGTNAADNSGVLRYVRIEFGGIAFADNNEINGLTMGGVGSGTTIDYVQCSYTNDDSYEFFGGTVNPKHLIAFRGVDDDFDTDNGFSGTVQFGVSLRDPEVADEAGASNCFESDNDANSTSTAPYTSAVFTNMTICGPKAQSSSTFNPKYKNAALLRRNTKISIYNTIMMGFPSGINIDSITGYNAIAGDIAIKGVVMAGSDVNLTSNATFDITSWYNNTNSFNEVLSQNQDVSLYDPFNLDAPDFLPTQNAEVLSGAQFSDAKLANAQVVSYRGAFGTEDWTNGWASWIPNDNAYTEGYTATKEIADNRLSVNVFPNPTKGDLTVALNSQINSDLQIIVSNFTGQITTVAHAFLMSGNQEILINTNDLANGFYCLRLITNEGQKSIKFCVSK